jgi:hypothetical protein
MSGSQEALDRFERQAAWPMMALALAIIPLLVVPLLVDLPSGAEATFIALDWFDVDGHHDPAVHREAPEARWASRNSGPARP